MASSPGSSVRAAPPAPRPERDRLIEDELQRTRRQLKGVDVTAALLTLAAGSLGYLLLMALVDHWIMPHGLGFATRVAACAVLVVAVVVYSCFRLLPLIVRRINPIYAAQTIEQSRPSLKNSIINFLLLRSHQSELAPVIYEAVQQRAAADLAGAPTESAIDRSRLIKLGYVLVAIIAVTAIYKVFSPKDPWRSMGRIVAPWANIAVPTRVRIEAIEPGDTQVFQDARLKVSALVRGIGAEDPVTLYYSTADSQVVRQPIRMRLPEGSYRYSAELPDTSSGLAQDSTYYITAGDAISPVYQIHVATSPTITVERVDYKYPAYTELEPRSVERQGDLQAIEGTLVTLHTRTSHDIKKANVDFERDGKLDLPMQAHGREAQVTFPLNLKDRQSEHSNYQLHFINSQGEANSNPTMYRIEVIRDLPPEVAFTEPKADPQQEIPLAERGGLRLVIEAADPDFKLQEVTLHARCAGRPLADISLLSEKDGRAGKFRISYLFSAKNERYTLRARDLVEIWAEAADNKTPEPNRTETPHLKIRIGSPQSQQDQLADARNKQHQPPEAPPPDAGQKQPNGRDQRRQPGAPPEERPDQPPPQGERDQQNAGQKKSGQQDGAPGAPPQDQRVDPDDPGKVIEKLNDDSEKQPPRPGDRQQPGEKQNPDQQNADQQNPGGGEQKPEEKSPEKQPKSGSGQGDSGQGQSGQGQSGQGQSKQQGQSGQQGEQKQAGKGQTGDGKSGGQENQSGKQQSGKQQQSEKSGQDQQQPGGGKQESGQGQGSKPTGEMPNEGQPGGGDSKQKSAEENPGSGRGQRSGQTEQANPQGGGKSGDQKGGENTPEGSAGGSGQPQQSSSGGSGGKQTGQGKSSQGQSSQGQSPQDKSDQGQSGQGKPGDSQSGQAKPGQNQSGEGKAGQNQSGQAGGKSGSTSSGDKSSQTAGADQSGRQHPANQPGQQPSGTPKDGAAKEGAAGQERGSEQSAGSEQGADKQGDSKTPGGQQKSGREATGAEKSDGAAQGKDSTAMKPQPGGKDSQDGKTQDGKNAQGGQPDASGEQRAAKPGQTGDKQSGQGAESRESQDKSGQQKSGGGQSKSEQPGGDRENSKGSAGDGQSKGDEKGTPSSQDDNRPRNKQSGNPQSPGDSKNQKDSSDGNSPSRSGHESDSSGDSSGDQSGGGQKGGGQRANRPGTGGAGKNTASDEGGSHAQEKGSGDTSNKGGDQQKAGKPVDNAASRGQGPGSKSQAGNSKPGGEQPGGKGPEGGPQADRPGEPSSGQGPGGVGNPTGGGPSDQNAKIERQPPKEAAPGEDPNLEYARKATDLALEKLKDQLKKPAGDQALLDKLGWTRADAERFVKRWEAMKQAAGQSGAQGDAAKRQLNDALRSLGLRPRGTTISGDRAGGDRQRNLREGLRTRPPAEYADQYRAYTTGTSQAQRGTNSGQGAAGSK